MSRIVTYFHSLSSPWAYLGGPHVFGKDRRLRVDGERPARGFHRFEVSGRKARALEAVEPPDQVELPKARGHLVAGWLVSASDLARVSLLPEDEPPPFATTFARRWHSGDLLFDTLDFDGERRNRRACSSSGARRLAI